MMHKIHILTVLTAMVTFDQRIFAAKNEIKYERLICEPTEPESKMQSISCNVKYISRTQLKIDVHGNLTKSITTLWAHTVFYYKFNSITYQKFPIDLWENICDYLAGKSKSYFMDWTFGRAIEYSNVNHPCPYIGLVFVKVNNISVDRFPFEPLVPSGKYRVDFTFSETNTDDYVLFRTKLYFTVSDHRLEVF